MAKVEIQFIAEDDASGPIKTISGEITDLGKEAEKADKKSKGLGSALGGIGKVVAGAGIGLAVTAIAGLGAALVSGIGDAREANIIMGQTRAVIASTGAAAGVTAEHVAELSGALSAASGKSLFGDSQIQESTNLLLTFTNIKGAALDAATAISVDMAQALGGAPADAALQLGKALNDPINGITALSRVGVTFTEQQKEQIKTMQEAGDTAGAQAIIIAELNKEFGGSAEAAARADGGMAMFKDRMGELAESIGAQLLPMLNSLLAWLNSPEVMAAITTIVNGLMQGLGAAFTWISTVAIPVLLAAFQVAWPIIQQTVQVVYAWLHDVFWPWMQNTAFPWLTNVALPALQAVFQVVWPIIKTAVELVYTFLKDVVWAWLQNTAFPWIANVGLPAVQTAFETVWPIIKTAVQTTYTFLHDTVWPWLQTAMTNIVTWVNTAQAGWSAAWSLISGAVESAKNTISGVIATIKSLVQGAIDKINALIGLINSIPGVNIPSIPSVGGGGLSRGGGSGFGTNSAGSFASLGASSASTTTSNVIHIDARNATDPRGVADNVRHALDQAGIRGELRTRMA